LKFTAVVIPSGNATGVEVPAAVMQALGPAGRPAVSITVNGHTWRSRVARMRGQTLVGISAAHRAASGIAEGDTIEVELELDTEPREVPEPPDLAKALDADPQARAGFDRLPFGLKQKHVGAIEASKSPQVRQRRIEKLVEAVGSKPG
jgi:uncharacterized protein YdeI (YjbR/CyaY-like superfamily)